MEHVSSSGATATQASRRSGTLATVSVLSTGQSATGALVGRVSATEAKRRLLHFTPGLLPFLLWVIPHQDPWGPLLADCVLALSVVIVATALMRHHVFARAGENDWTSSVLGYAAPILAALCIFRGREEIGVMTLAIVAFGDGSATLGGLMLRGPTLPWNCHKSWSGSLCFVVFGTLMGTVIYWGEARPMVSWGAAALIAGGATLAAAMAESLPVRLNDNLRVGMTAAILGGALSLLVVG